MQGSVAWGVLLILGCGVSGVDQGAELELATFEPAGAAAWPAGEQKSQSLWIGSRGAHELVPAALEWEVTRDTTGCLRIKNARLRRTGGPTSVELYEVSFKVDPAEACAPPLAGVEQRFERIHLSYCWRWNGARNDAHCAYSGGVTLRSDAVGVEGKDKDDASR